MTRKDYVLLAAALRDAKPNGYGQHIGRINQWRKDCAAVCNALAQDNGAFDRARFITACEETKS